MVGEFEIIKLVYTHAHKLKICVYFFQIVKNKNESKSDY